MHWLDAHQRLTNVLLSCATPQERREAPRGPVSSFYPIRVKTTLPDWATAGVIKQLFITSPGISDGATAPC